MKLTESSGIFLLCSGSQGIAFTRFELFSGTCHDLIPFFIPVV
jgi:hypothetical protein